MKKVTQDHQQDQQLDLEKQSGLMNQNLQPLNSGTKRNHNGNGNMMENIDLFDNQNQFGFDHILSQKDSLHIGVSNKSQHKGANSQNDVCEQSQNANSNNNITTTQVAADNLLTHDPQPINARYFEDFYGQQENKPQIQQAVGDYDNNQSNAVSIDELVDGLTKEIEMKKMNYAQADIKNKNDETRKSSGFLNTAQKTNNSLDDDDEYFAQESEQKSAKKQRFMNPEQFHRLRDHEVEWNFSVFFEFLFYHFVFYFLLGPFANIIFYKQEKLFRNFGFLGNIRTLYIQSVVYFMNVYNLVLYFTSDNAHIFTIEIVYMEVVLFLRIYIIACKYATLHPDKIELYRNYVLEGELTLQDYYFARWVFQSDITVYRESYNAFQRGEFDSSMFYMGFFIPPTQECMHEFEDGIQALKKWHKQDSVFQAPCIFPQEDSVYCYGILYYLIKSFTKKNPNKLLLVMALVLAFLRGFLLIFYRLIDKSQSSDLNFTKTEILQMVGIIFNTSFGYFSSFIFLIFFTKDLKLKIFLQKQCIHLLSPKKLNLGVQKLLPTIDFADPYTLKTWSMFRRLCLDYGKPYYMRLEAFISIYLFVAAFSLVALLLWLFNVYKMPTNIGVACGFEAFIIFFFLFYILIYGALINTNFDQNKNLLLDHQMIFDDIMRLRQFYFSEGSKLSNIVRQRVVGKIQNKLKLKGKFDDVYEQKVINHLKDILEGIKDCHKELEQDSINQPFQFFGITVTIVLVQNILVALGTSAVGVIQYYISKKK